MAPLHLSPRRTRHKNDCDEPPGYQLGTLFWAGRDVLPNFVAQARDSEPYSQSAPNWLQHSSRDRGATAAPCCRANSQGHRGETMRPGHGQRAFSLRQATTVASLMSERSLTTLPDFSNRVLLTCSDELFARPARRRLDVMAEDMGVEDVRPPGERPLISVVIPVRNGMPWLEHQLRALAAQQIGFDWEVVVADNGSDDETDSCVLRWSERCPRIHLVDASARTGAGAARNIGAGAANGSLLAFCDADDVVRPGWLASMSAALADADLVAGVFDFSALDGVPQSVPVPAATRQLGFLPFALGANFGVRREAFEAVRGFSEELSAGEDVDLCWRLQLAGYRFAVNSGAAVEKRERTGVRALFNAAWSYGQCGPRLFRSYRADGMQRDIRGAAKAWVWLVVASPGLVIPNRRRQWLRTFGIRAGRLASSLHQRVFFP